MLAAPPPPPLAYNFQDDAERAAPRTTTTTAATEVAADRSSESERARKPVRKDPADREIDARCTGVRLVRVV